MKVHDDGHGPHGASNPDNGNDGAKHAFKAKASRRLTVQFNSPNQNAPERRYSAQLMRVISAPSSFLKLCCGVLHKSVTWQKLFTTKGKWIWWPVMVPDCQVIFTWEITGLFFLTFELLSIPYRLSFDSPAEGAFKVAEWISCLFFLCDMLLMCFKGSFQNGLPVVEPIKIIRQYMQGWFWVDLVISFPWLWMFTEAGVLRIGRIVKLPKVLARIESFAEMFCWGYFCVALARVCLFMVLLSHFCACFWYYTGVNGLPVECKQKPWDCTSGVSYWAWFSHIDWTDPSWQGSNNRLLMYLQSFYFVMASITTVGYGEIHPVSQEERMFAVVMFLVAIIAFSACMGSIAEIMKTVHHSKGIYRNHMKDLARYMRWRNLPYNLQVRLRRYLQYLWEHESDLAQKEETILAQISPSLRHQICNHLYGQQLQKVPFLKWATKYRVPFETMLSGCRSTFGTPGEMLFFEGQMDTTIYIVTEGRIAVIETAEEVVDEAHASDHIRKLSEMISYQAENITVASGGTAASADSGWSDITEMPEVTILQAPCYIGESNVGMLSKIPRPPGTVTSPPTSPKQEVSNTFASFNEPMDLSCPRTYTAICLSHCQLTTLDVDTVADMLRDYPFVWSDFDEFKKEKEADSSSSSSSSEDESRNPTKETEISEESQVFSLPDISETPKAKKPPNKAKFVSNNSSQAKLSSNDGGCSPKFGKHSSLSNQPKPNPRTMGNLRRSQTISSAAANAAKPDQRGGSKEQPRAQRGGGSGQIDRSDGAGNNRMLTEVVKELVSESTKQKIGLMELKDDFKEVHVALRKQGLVLSTMCDQIRSMTADVPHVAKPQICSESMSQDIQILLRDEMAKVEQNIRGAVHEAILSQTQTLKVAASEAVQTELSVMREGLAPSLPRQQVNGDCMEKSDPAHEKQFDQAPSVEILDQQNEEKMDWQLPSSAFGVGTAVQQNQPSSYLEQHEVQSEFRRLDSKDSQETQKIDSVAIRISKDEKVAVELLAMHRTSYKTMQTDLQSALQSLNEVLSDMQHALIGTMQHEVQCLLVPLHTALRDMQKSAKQKALDQRNHDTYESQHMQDLPKHKSVDQWSHFSSGEMQEDNSPDLSSVAFHSEERPAHIETLTDNSGFNTQEAFTETFPTSSSSAPKPARQVAASPYKARMTAESKYSSHPVLRDSDPDLQSEPEYHQYGSQKHAGTGEPEYHQHSSQAQVKVSARGTSMHRRRCMHQCNCKDRRDPPPYGQRSPEPPPYGINSPANAPQRSPAPSYGINSPANAPRHPMSHMNRMSPGMTGPSEQAHYTGYNGYWQRAADPPVAIQSAPHDMDSAYILPSSQTSSARRGHSGQPQWQTMMPSDPGGSGRRRGPDDMVPMVPADDVDQRFRQTLEEVRYMC